MQRGRVGGAINRDAIQQHPLNEITPVSKSLTRSGGPGLGTGPAPQFAAEHQGAEVIGGGGFQTERDSMHSARSLGPGAPRRPPRSQATLIPTGQNQRLSEKASKSGNSA